KLIIEDRQVASLSLDLAPKQATAASVNFRVEGKSTMASYVQIEDFPVEFDNTYFFTLTPSSGVNIIEITDGRSLSLNSLYSKEPLFRYSQFQAGNVDFAKVNSADIVILNGLQDINTALATTINNY